MAGGDRAGQQTSFSEAGCPGTCVGAFAENAQNISQIKLTQNLIADYVNNDPTAFADAYWDIASLRVYSAA